MKVMTQDEGELTHRIRVSFIPINQVAGSKRKKTVNDKRLLFKH